jgi:hypothetical protein
VEGSREPPGAGGCAHAQRVGGGRAPVGARRAAPPACIRSDTGCISVELAEAEGFAQAVARGALQFYDMRILCGVPSQRLPRWGCITSVQGLHQMHAPLLTPRTFYAEMLGVPGDVRKDGGHRATQQALEPTWILRDDTPYHYIRGYVKIPPMLGGSL